MSKKEPSKFTSIVDDLIDYFTSGAFETPPPEEKEEFLEFGSCGCCGKIITNKGHHSCRQSMSMISIGGDTLIADAR